MLKNIRNIVRKIFTGPLDPQKAYDIWSEIYDQNDDNLVFLMENKILDSLFSKISLRNKTILDYGCGTGRNWKRLLSLSPVKLIGCDISAGMLEQLKKKYSGYEIYLLKNNSFIPINNLNIEFIFSTLVAAQIKNLKSLFLEWDRLLKPGGFILITDMHPEALTAGGKRTFEKNGKHYEVKNYIHSIEEIKLIGSSLNYKIIELKEEIINEDSKEFYSRKNALHIYEKFRGMPLVYGILLEKIK